MAMWLRTMAGFALAAGLAGCGSSDKAQSGHHGSGAVMGAIVVNGHGIMVHQGGGRMKAGSPTLFEIEIAQLPSRTEEIPVEGATGTVAFHSTNGATRVAEGAAVPLTQRSAGLYTVERTFAAPGKHTMEIEARTPAGAELRASFDFQVP